MTSLAVLLAEKQRRADVARQADRAEQYKAIAADLRSWFYDKQAAFFASPAKRKATVKTRRAGATSGGCHEFVARALEQPGWRGIYVNEIRAEARTLAWRADTKQGMVDILEALQLAGRLKIGSERKDLAKDCDVKIDDAAMAIDFRNGSQIRVFCADDARSLERARGGAPHVVWCDEAQKQPGLQTFIDDIIGPSLTDFDGEMWLTGTPSLFLDGYFYAVTGADERVAGWEIHVLRVTDNPMYGATPEERWARTAGAEIARNGWDPDNPPASFRREWLAEWVKEDARFVISIHRWPEPVLFAPLRTTPIVPPWFERLNPDGIGSPLDRWYDHEAAKRDLPSVLPGTTTAIDWFYGLGVDFGYNPDPFALVLWAFSPSLPTLYEMWSWKRTLVLPDYQRDAVMWFFESIRGLLNVDGDAGGLQGAHMEGWRELLGLPIEDADKAAKRTWTELFNNDGERGRVKLREGSPLVHEMRHLTWKQSGGKLVENADRKLADGTVPGNHCFVAGTLVATAAGDVPIEEVRDGERVWTREGLRRVLISTPTRVTETWRLDLDDGRVLVGTGDHLIMTSTGWKELQSLTPDDTVTVWASTGQVSVSSSTASSTADTLSQICTRCASTSPPRRGSDCIARFGRRHTGQSQQGCTSITSTTIHSTTNSPTSLCGAPPSTCESTHQIQHASQSQGTAWRSPGLPPLHGTDLLLDGNGTVGTPRRSPLPAPSSVSCAKCADAASSPSCCLLSAAGHVEPSDGVTPGLTTATSPVPSATACFAGTGTSRPSTAPGRVRCVSRTGLVQQTYELAVDDVHEFFANGIVVANCNDAALYSYRRYVNRNRDEYQPPPAEGTPEWYAAEEKRMHEAAQAQTRAALEQERADAGVWWSEEW